MAKTCADMITRVKALIGRSTASGTLSLDPIILDELNEAQLEIVRRSPRLTDLQVKDITTLDAATDTYSYDISSSTFTIPIAHLRDVWVMDGEDSQWLRFMDRHEFDRRYPSVSDIASALPDFYTRRGDTIEFNCPIKSDYNGNAIRVDYCKWATPFASTDSTEASDLVDADKGLILFAVAGTLRTIAKGDTRMLQRATIERGYFEDWLGKYQAYHDIMTE